MKWTLRSACSAVVDFLFGEGEQKKMNATEAIKAMQETLSARADLAAFKQQGAEDLEADLRNELVNNQRLEAEAAQLLTQGNTADAQLRMAQKIVSDERLTALSERLTAARDAASMATSQFALEQQRVQQREAELPQVMADEAYLRRQKEIEERMKRSGGSGGAVTAFDAHAKSVRTEIGAAEKRDRLLTGGVDPTRELAIQTTLNTARLNDAMAQLQKRIAAGEVAGLIPDSNAQSASERAKLLLGEKAPTTAPPNRQIEG